MGIIAKARFYLSSQTLMTLYYSLVYPFLTYCNVAWSSTYCSNLNCIYLLQKRLVRLITKAHYLANTAPLFSQLKVLDIFSINSFSVATFMYSYHHNLLPSSFRDLFLSSNQVHQYETRLASQYRPHFCNPVSFTEDLKSGIRCLFHSLALLLYLFFFFFFLIKELSHW